MSDAAFERRRAEGVAKWARIRARGRLHFALFWGGLVWGGLMFLLMGVGFSTLLLGTRALAPAMLAGGAVLWFGGGVLFGFGAWHFNEKTYHKHRAATAGNHA